MDSQLKARWIEALRSGKYKQARYRLKQGDALCCLNVGFKVKTGRPAPAKIESGFVAAELGIPPEHFTTLVLMNDFDMKSFPEIADYIEANL